MNKAELVAKVGESTGLTKKDAEKAVNAFTTIVSDELANGGKVQLIGFGTFLTAERAAKKCKNPQTGEQLTIAAHTVPKFKAGTVLKDKVNA